MTGSSGDRFDKTLTKTDLERRSESEKLLTNTDPLSFKGAAYDFRAGEEAIVARPHQDEPKHILLKNEEDISIDPGSAVTFRSLEELDLPRDVKGRLSPKSALANKKIFYPGGIIDPGYSGYVWFTFFNLGSREFKVEYGDQIVTGEFIQINPTTEYNEGERIEDLRDDLMPRVPAVDDEFSFDWGDINDQLQSVRRNSEDIQELEKDVSRLDNITNYLILAIVAGAVGGIIAGVTVQILSIYL